MPSPALVEKDWHVVQALAAIHEATSDGLALVFGGGTALGRAHRLLSRMSEDIDLRIVGEQAPGRGALRRLRGVVTGRLANTGFQVEGNVDVKQGDKYVRYDLPYDPIMSGEGVLRPEIKIEIAAFPIRRPAVEKMVCSFYSEARGDAPEIPSIACVALAETAAEKFVALTRRIGEAFDRDERADRTLVRHIYDLFQLGDHCDPADVAELAGEIMIADADRGYDAYKADPLAETLRTMDRIAIDDVIRSDYDALMLDMVYGNRPTFKDAAVALDGIAARLRRR